MKWLGILFTLFLLGCSATDEFRTDLREYTVNDLHVVVGVGKWQGDRFVIQSYDGNVWESPRDVPIYESAVTLDSFKRVTK